MAADATETSAGLKETLTRGADSAVAQLGKPNGFLGDPRVRIPLPESARSAEKMMRTLGMKKQADELIETMNRAAARTAACSARNFAGGKVRLPLRSMSLAVLEPARMT